MAKRKENKIILWGAIVAIVIFALTFVLVSSEADSGNTQQFVNINAVPFFSGTLTTALSSHGPDETSITLTEATTTTIYVYGTADDDNGCGEIDAAADYTVVYYRSGVAGAEECNTNPLNCYHLLTPVDASLAGTCLGGGDLEVNFQFSQDVQFYADPTNAGTYAAQNWVVYVGVEDEPAGTSYGEATDTFEMVASNALNVSASIDYGDVIAGMISDEKSMSIYNTGNSNIDYNIKGDGDMACDVSSIPLANTRYNLTESAGYDAGAAVTTNDVAVDASIPRQTSGSSPTSDLLYFYLRTVAGVSGTCDNILTFTAISDS